MNSPAGVHAADADSATALERTLFALTLLLVGMAAFTGGGSQDREAGDAATQLLAWVVDGTRPTTRTVLGGIIAVGGVIALRYTQLPAG